MKKNQDPFKAGQDHLHHILFKKTNSKFVTNLIIFLLNIIFFVIGYLSYLLINPLASLMIFISIFVIYYIFRENYS